MKVYRTFPYQVGLVVLLWPLLVILHLHWSGYGLTKYLSFMDWLRPVMANVPGINAYNVPVACGLSLCGYPLTNLMHGMALIVVFLTIDLPSKDLNVWKAGLIAFVGTIGFGVGWEKWELAKGVTILKPESFGSTEQLATEAMRLLNDTVDDILFGLIFLIATMIIVMVLDKYFNYTYPAGVD